MLAKGKPQLPPIDYVLASVAYGFDARRTAEIPHSSSIDEPLEAALLQWGKKLTASRILNSPVSSPSSASPSASRRNPAHSAADRADKCTVPARYTPVQQLDAPLASYQRAPPGAPLSPTSPCQAQIDNPLHAQLPPVVERGARHPSDTSGTPSQRSSSKLVAPKPEPPAGGGLETQRRSTRKRKQPVKQRVQKHRKRTAQMVVNQIAMCRERLSEINFRAIERPDGLMECSICQETYRTKALVTRHAISHLDDPKPFACTVCNKRFSRCDTLHRHSERRACKVEPLRSPSAWEESCHVLNIKPS